MAREDYRDYNDYEARLYGSCGLCGGVVWVVGIKNFSICHLTDLGWVVGIVESVRVTGAGVDCDGYEVEL